MKIFPGLMISRAPSLTLISTSFFPNCWWLMQCAGHSFLILVVKIVGFASGLPHDFWELSAVTFSWLWNIVIKIRTSHSINKYTTEISTNFYETDVRLLVETLCTQFWGPWKPQLFKCCLKVETHKYLAACEFQATITLRKVIANISPIWIRNCHSQVVSTDMVMYLNFRADFILGLL